MQMDLKEAARLFNISEREMRRWIEVKGVPAHSVQDSYRFNRAELAEWAHVQGLAIDSQPAADGLPTIEDALKVGGIMRLGGIQSREQALRSLVTAMPLPPKTDREELFRILLEREMVSSTGIGEGIAIPHVRSPLIVRTEVPLINLCLLECAIDFKAIDAKPVHALFTMISPNARLHLHLISHLAMVLHDGVLSALLKERADDNRIMAALRKAESSLAGRGK